MGDHICPLLRQRDSWGALEWSSAVGSEVQADGGRKTLNFSLRATIGINLPSHMIGCFSWVTEQRAETGADCGYGRCSSLSATVDSSLCDGFSGTKRNRGLIQVQWLMTCSSFLLSITINSRLCARTLSYGFLGDRQCSAYPEPPHQ